MASIQGFYINLETHKERETILREELSKIGKLHLYKRFQAKEGDETRAKAKKLSKGEHGLWMSWIKLLEEIQKDCSEDYDYVHIVEDDALISEQFYDFAAKLSNKSPVADMIMTDMYVNINIYEFAVKLMRGFPIQGTSGEIRLTKEYTGCAASCLIHKSKTEKVLNVLKGGYEESSVIPIDNYFRRMNRKGTLSVATTLPFLTSVQLWSIGDSTIQNREKDKCNARNAITQTQQYNTYLRRMLSVYKDKADIVMMTKLALEITGSDEVKTEKLNSNVIEALNEYLMKERLLRYRREKRLDNDDNPQILYD
ncbi:glycosyltransferase family 25 protein [Synechococcus sp. AH-736-M20]|nr:glycosyltransferase family 25 protein [Synechococcus sp. AH-736-M20]